MIVQHADLKISPPPRSVKFNVETAIALVGTLFSIVLLFLTAIYAGPLWRDEINTFNLAQMSSVKEMWDNMPYESFPPLWPLILRGLNFLGTANNDANIRVVGLYVGILFFISLWLCSRWIGSRAPTLSIALLGCLPAFIFIIGANRAYGLASCLLVLTFGMIWRMMECPSKLRIFWTWLIAILFVHCVYYDILFLGAMLCGAAIVVIKRTQWKTLSALIAIGVSTGMSLMIYLPIIHRGSAYISINQPVSFNPSILWYKFDDAVTARSSARIPASYSSAFWIWIVLLMAGSILALAIQRKRARRADDQKGVANDLKIHADLTLFCIISLLCGVLGYMAFLLNLHYVTQTWYYIEMLCLCAVSFDGLLVASLPALNPWGLLRVGFMMVIMTWYARSALEEAHTRRSNIDLIAIILNKNASDRDFIVVQSAWEGITFNRYYRGRAHWVTVPPISSHEVHRNDLVVEKLNQQDPMAPVLREITDTLQNSNSVWIIGNMSPVSPKPSHLAGQPIKWWLSFLDFWSGQVTASLQSHALREQIFEIQTAGPVNYLENLPVRKFSGYRSAVDVPGYHP